MIDRSRISPTLRTCCVAAAAALLAACSGNSPQQQVAAAKVYLDKHDTKAAVIQLKNALQKTPDSAETRFLLGRALLDGGDAVGATVELNKALDLKHPDAQVLPLLARALNASGQSRKLTSTYGATVLPDADAMAELKTELAQAYGAQGDAEQARKELAAALAASPGNATAKVMDASVRASQGDVDAALATINAVNRETPANEVAWLLKAYLLRRAKSDVPGAIEAFRQALVANKNSTAARVGLIDLYLFDKQLDAAAAELAALQKASPNGAQARWFEAQIAFQRGDMKETRRLTEALLAKTPNDARLLYLAGVADLKTGALVQAKSELSKALQVGPENAPVRQALAQTELQLGQPAKALAVLQPVLDKEAPGTPALMIAAQAHLLNGNAAQAQTYLERAAKADPSSSRTRTALALTRLKEGDSSTAVDELQRLAAADKGPSADPGLIAALLQRKDIAGALAAIDRFEKKDPKNPLPVQLRGNVLLGQKDVAGARANFERALAMDPTYVPAAARLAALDLADKKPEQAQQRFERVLAANPKNQQALFGLADLAAVSGRPKEQVAELIGNAVKANPGEALPRLKLIDQQLRNGDAKAALATAQSGVTALPDSAEMLDALGAAQLAAGETNQAIASFNKLLAMRPDSPAVHVRLAAAHAAAKDDGATIQSLQRALAADPNATGIQALLVARLAAAGRHADGLKFARDVQKQRPADAIGYLFEGDVEASRSAWPATIAAYRTALAKGRSTAAAIKLHGALIDSRQKAEADKMAAGWLAQSPDDVVFLSHLGDSAIVTKDYATAEARYLDVLRLQPQQATAMNNVAWLMTEQKKNGAIAYAEKANQLQPNQPAYMDTLATVLAANAQLDRALALQKKAVDLQPEAPMFRLHLARMYIQSGDKPAARAELARLSKLGAQFVNQPEVEQLLKTL